MKRVPTNFKRWAPQRVKGEHHRPPFSIREVIPLWASPTLRKGSPRTRRLKLSFMVSLVCRTGSVSPFTSRCEIKAQLPFSPQKALCLLCLFPSHPVCKNHFGGFDEEKKMGKVAILSIPKEQKMFMYGKHNGPRRSEKNLKWVENHRNKYLT